MTDYQPNTTVADRLKQACDGYHFAPRTGEGRLEWIKYKLSNRFDIDVSLETVRRWFAGESTPQSDDIASLAEILEVDVLWLERGLLKRGGSNKPS